MSTTISEEAQPQTIRLTNGRHVTIKSNVATSNASIPTIDVSRMFSPDLADRKAVAEEVREACRNIGFFTIINHGIDPALSQNVLDQAKEFFALPLEQKMSVSADLIPEEFCGYHPIERYNINGSKRRDLHEAFNWNYDPSLDPLCPSPGLPSINLWPSASLKLPNFRPALCAYQSSLITLSRTLTRIFALALHLPENYFDSSIITPEAGARVVHYPPQLSSRSEQNGIGAHTDVEYFTIVHADSPGLEVLSKEGEWQAVKPREGGMVVNLGDCFMRITDDFFVSTTHRVINQMQVQNDEYGKETMTRERYSVPFFWGFDRTAKMEVVPTCRPPGDGAGKYEEMTAGEYYAWRTKEQRKEWTQR